jgi:hypothetical protein
MVVAAVDAGSTAIQRVQIETAGRTFDVLEAVPPLARAARVVRVAHDTWVGGVHGIIRLVNRGVGAGLDVVIDVIEDDRRETNAEAAPVRREPN